MSYCWETREHPDPEGNSLLALADALDKCYEQKQKGTVRIRPVPVLPLGHWHLLGLPVSFPAPAGRQAHRRAGSALQGAPFGRPAPAAAARARAACRLSVPRSRRLSPQWALEALDLIYAHEGTTIFRLIDSAPPTRPSYFQSGWTNYESGTRPPRTLSLSHRSPRLSPLTSRHRIAADASRILKVQASCVACGD